MFKNHIDNVYKIISIDGNIGAGKSTILNIIKSQYKQVIIVPEPIDIWLKTVDNDNNNNILQMFYNDKLRWSYTFQNFV